MIVEQDILSAADWIWFHFLAQDDYNYRSQEGIKQIQYDERIWRFQGIVHPEEIRELNRVAEEDDLDSRFVLARNTSSTGYQWGKIWLFYTAPYKILQLDDEL